MIVDARSTETFDVLGPTIEFLTRPGATEDEPCVMRGTIPAGVAVPLHSHPDPETFVVLSGEVEGLVPSRDGMRWVRIGPGGVFHVPGDRKHAFRNGRHDPAVMIVVSTTRIGLFFREVAGPPSPETIEHFLRTADRYGYWNATPEENAEVGIRLPG
jgi:quercetin dioxygenase-like cupin family protein